jgi:N-acylglucosamine 2-epimerase
LWTFSALARRVEAVEDWRLTAESIYGFLLEHGRDRSGRWNFLLDERGHVLLDSQSIIADAFAIYGLVEYYHLSGRAEALEVARQTYESCLERLSKPGSYKTALYPTPPGMKAHREAMQFSLMLFELGRALGEESVIEKALGFSDEVLQHFYRWDRGVLLEYLGADNEPWDTPAGRAMVPGHGIESLWFQIHIRSSREISDSASARRAASAMQSCFEKGWDPQYGGLFLGIDVEGKHPPYWKLADTKRWWPHCEALCGSLLAYEQIGEPWCLQWYWKTHEWAFGHFPDEQHGEWVQNLDRTGRPLMSETSSPRDERAAQELAARSGATKTWISFDLNIKDPFHLPRALIVACEALERIAASEAQ